LNQSLNLHSFLIGVIFFLNQSSNLHHSSISIISHEETPKRICSFSENQTPPFLARIPLLHNLRCSAMFHLKIKKGFQNNVPHGLISNYWKSFVQSAYTGFKITKTFSELCRKQTICYRYQTPKMTHQICAWTIQIYFGVDFHWHHFITTHISKVSLKMG
jgi:hypothetical protein